MYTPGDKIPRIGRVSIDIHGKSYRLRFTYPEGNPHSFTVARATPEGWATTIKAAQLINRDIDLGDFDDTYARYSPKHAKKLQVLQIKARKEYNLKELWEAYKKTSENRVAPTTQKNLWKVLNKAIEKCNPKLLNLKEAANFISYLQDSYATTTIKTLFRTCIDPWVNQAVRSKKIPFNPYDTTVLPKLQKKKIECFEPNEVKAIIKAFYSDRFVSSKSRPTEYFTDDQVAAYVGAREETVKEWRLGLRKPRGTNICSLLEDFELDFGRWRRKG